MRLIKCYMTQSTWYKGAKNGTPKGVLWHSTGANNPYISRYVQPDDNAKDKTEMIALLGKNKYGNDWNHIEHNAGVNAWIGKLTDGSIATVEAGPHTKKAWGCGDKASRLKNGWSLNETHLQFEICEDGLNNKEYFEKVFQEAAEYTAYICELYNLDPMGTFTYKGETIPVITDHIGSHNIGHGGNHGDVGHWFKKYLGSDYMTDIKKKIKEIMDSHKTEKEEVKEEPKQEEVKTNVKVGDLVKVTGFYYYSGQAIPAWVKNQNWYVMSVSGDKVVINENEAKTNKICSPVKASDVVVVKAKEEPKEEVKQEENKTEATAEIKKGDLVKIKKGSKYYNGKDIPDWVENQKWYVMSISGDRAVINENEKKTSKICSPINIQFLEKAATTEPQYRVHTVVKGDSLWEIAKKYLGNGMRYTEIKKLNNLSSNTIYSGQKLKIPNK